MSEHDTDYPLLLLGRIHRGITAAYQHLHDRMPSPGNLERERVSGGLPSYMPMPDREIIGLYRDATAKLRQVYHQLRAAGSDVWWPDNPNLDDTGRETDPQYPPLVHWHLLTGYVEQFMADASLLDDDSVSQLEAAADVLSPFSKPEHNHRQTDGYCRNCYSPRGPFRHGRCDRCRKHLQRTGRERPSHLWRNSA